VRGVVQGPHQHGAVSEPVDLRQRCHV
jgi:hypothetical protein